MGGQRKKKGGRVTPKGGAPPRLTAAERAGLDDIFEQILRSAPMDLEDDLPPLAVEVWASQMWSIWANYELIGMYWVADRTAGLRSGRPPQQLELRHQHSHESALPAGWVTYQYGTRLPRREFGSGGVTDCVSATALVGLSLASPCVLPPAR